MPKLTLQNDDKVFISTSDQRRMHKNGIPREFWPLVEEKEVRFSPYQYRSHKKDVVSALVQRDIFKCLCHETRRNHPIIGIFCKPTDSGALTAAYSLLDSYAEKGYPVLVTDGAEISQIKWIAKYPACLVVHNVLTKASPQRLEDVRDILNKFRYSLRIVVIAGETKTPIDQFKLMFGITPQYCICYR